MTDKLLNNNRGYIRTLEVKHSDYFDSLSPQLQESLRYYTGEGYKNINYRMRGKSIMSDYSSLDNQMSQLNTHIENIKQVLYDAPPLQYDIEVCRGMSLPGNMTYKNGDIIDLFKDSFISTTFDPDIAIDFTGQECCLFIMYLTSGTRGLYIGNQSRQGDESEFILPPGYVFKVIKKITPASKLLIRPNVAIYYVKCINCEYGQNRQLRQSRQPRQKAEVIVSNIDPKYLMGLSSSILEKVKQLTYDCPYNMIHNPQTGRCVTIDGSVGKKVIALLRN